MLKKTPNDRVKRAAWIFASGSDSDPKKKKKETIFQEPPQRQVVVPEEKDPDDEDDDQFYGTDPREQRIAKLSKENGRRRVDNKALRTAIEQQKEEIADLRAELKKAQRLEQDYNNLQDEVSVKDKNLKKMAITNAILAEEKVEGDGQRAWYDVSMVYSLLDHDELSVDLGDFTVGGIKEQLDKIAGDKPFLVKAAGQDGGEQNQNQNGNNDAANGQQPSGSAPTSSASGNRDQQKKQSESELTAAFPALANLV